MANNVVMKRGTRAKYDAILNKDSGTLYWLTDTLELYMGETLYGVGRDATAAVSGLLSAEDKARLDDLVASSITDLTAVDASVVVGGDGNSKTVGVQLSAVDGNVLRLEDDGLYVPSPEVIAVPEYSLERQSEAEDGFSATYRLRKTANGGSVYVGDAINIPRDLVLESGTLRTVESDDEPYDGAQVGDPYLDLVLNDTDESHIYVPVKGLVDVYTAGDGIVINNNVISVTNRTVERLSGPNGTAIIWNESDGGGAKFEHVDGTWSFVGVNDGGKDGITGQIYSVDSVSKLGTRINMTSNGFFYFKGKTSATAYTADDEIATKGDIAAAVATALVWEEI